jgi:hypothetical protein
LVFDPRIPIVVHDRDAHLWRETPRSPKGCAYPRPELVGTADQYEAAGAAGSVLLERVTPSRAKLAEHSQKVACAEVLLAAGLRTTEERLPFLGAAAGLYEQAGVLYAAAGLHSVVRELEQRQRRVITEGERLLRSVDWDGPSGEQMIGQLAIRDSWPLKFLGDQGRLVLLRVAERRTAQYALSVLVADPTTTERALQIVASRPAVQQLEVLDTLDLDNPWFRERLANSTGAARLRCRATRWSSGQTWRTAPLPA